ncbi:MAG: CdaR family protein [Caloramator sp.]|nr:CdaR family protein [Caloramator sp.]
MAVKDKQQIMVITASIFIAFILWLYVMGEKNPVLVRTIEDIPVTLYNTENISRSNLVMLPDQTFTINLTVKGRALDVFKVTKDDFKVEADMGGYLKRGDNNIPVEIKRKPQGIEVVSEGIFPYIRVKLDNLVAKAFPVNINVTGIPKQGYDNLEPIVKPSEILVVGPEEYINKVYYVEGQVDVTGSFSDINNSIVVKPYDRERRQVFNVETDPRYVDVFVSIKSAKQVPIKVVTKNSLPKGKVLKDINLTEPNIYILGDAKILNNIKEIETKPIDLQNIYQTTSKQVELNIPKGVFLKNKENSILVELAVENIIQKEIKLPISFQNQKEEYIYSPSQEEVTLIIRGSESQINQIDLKQFTAILDVSELSEGEFTVPIKIIKPEYFEVVNVEPEKIKLKISKK